MTKRREEPGAGGWAPTPTPEPLMGGPNPREIEEQRIRNEAFWRKQREEQERRLDGVPADPNEVLTQGLEDMAARDMVSITFDAPDDPPDPRSALYIATVKPEAVERIMDAVHHHLEKVSPEEGESLTECLASEIRQLRITKSPNLDDWPAPEDMPRAMLEAIDDLLEEVAKLKGQLKQLTLPEPVHVEPDSGGGWTPQPLNTTPIDCTCDTCGKTFTPLLLELDTARAVCACPLECGGTLTRDDVPPSLPQGAAAIVEEALVDLLGTANAEAMGLSNVDDPEQLEAFNRAVDRRASVRDTLDAWRKGARSES